MELKRCVVCNAVIPEHRLKRYKNHIMGVKTCSTKCSNAANSWGREAWQRKHNKKCL